MLAAVQQEEELTLMASLLLRACDGEMWKEEVLCFWEEGVLCMYVVANRQLGRCGRCSALSARLGPAKKPG